MDVMYAYACFLSFCVLVLSFSLHFFLYKLKETDNRKVVPSGRTGWPVIGESFDYLRSGWNGHPEKFIFDRMSKFSPIVFRTSLLLENMAVFCGAEGNKFLFSNENKLVQVWWPSSFAKIFPSIKTYGADDNKTRKILQNSLKPEALQRYVPIMDVITRQHFVVGWDGKEEVMTYELATNFAFWLACKIFVSIDDLERVRYLSGPFKSIVTGILSIPIDLPGTPFRRGINAANLIKKELVAIVKQRKIDLAEGKATTTQDILSHLIHFSNEDGNLLGEHIIADRILALLIGGHQSTSSAIAFIVKYLAELPEIYNGVYKEQAEIAKSKAPGELLNYEDLSKMKYSWNVACEVLRLVPPAQGAFREAITDFMYNGYSIPKGWKLYWSANATHQNPEFFPDPKKFDPSRFEGKGPTPYTFVPFGGGPHKCPGNVFAQLEILVFMHHLVTKYKWEIMIPDEQIVYDPSPTPAKGLPIRIYPRKAL